MPLQLMLLHVLIHGKRQKMSRVKAEKQLKTFLFFIVLTFDKTTSLPTHVKDQFVSCLKFTLDSEAWWDKRPESGLSQAI